MLLLHVKNKIEGTEYYIPFEGTTFKIDLNRGLVHCLREGLPEGGICIAEYGNYFIKDEKKRIEDNSYRIRNLMREITDNAIKAHDAVMYYEVKEYEATRPIVTD